MVINFIIPVILGFTIYLAFSLPVITYEHGFSYWQSRAVYHVLIFSTGGVAILVVRSLLKFTLFASSGLFLLLVHWLITDQNAIDRLYEFMRRDGVSRLERGLYTVSTNILLVILAVLLWNEPVYYTIALLTMALADKSGEIIGRVEGEHEYEVTGDKTMEGSLAVYIVSFIVITTGMYIAGLLVIPHIPFYLALALLVMIAEAISVKFLDNVLIPYLVAFGLIYLPMVVG